MTTITQSFFIAKWDYSSAGEHFVDIEGVTGSIPVSPTIKKIVFLCHNFPCITMLEAVLYVTFVSLNPASFKIENNFCGPACAPSAMPTS